MNLREQLCPADNFFDGHKSDYLGVFGWNNSCLLSIAFLYWKCRSFIKEQDVSQPAKLALLGIING
jgi:hypothetical protein